MTVDVVIAGGGPGGLMLACELALAGIRPVVLERLPERGTEQRANGLIGRVTRLIDQRGLYERLTGAAGPPRPLPHFVFGALPLDLTGLDDSPLYGLAVPQRRLEQVLEERALELGAEIRRGHEVLALSQDLGHDLGRNPSQDLGHDLGQNPGQNLDHDLGQDEAAVELQVRGPDGAEYRLRARYLVGCDGGHSTVRKAAGIGFPGVTTTDVVSRTAQVEVPGAVQVPGTTELDVPGAGRIVMYTWHRTERGAYAVMPTASGALTVAVQEWGGPRPGDDEPMTVAELRAALRRVLGADVPLVAPSGPGPHLLRRLNGRNTRLAETYRRGRVFLAGDAAHVHSAVGGPGLNLGLQDAANLGWKLAAAVHGWAPPGLLDTYEAERRPAAERVVMHSQAQSALMAPGPEITALRELFGELLRDLPAVRRIAALMAGAEPAGDGGPPFAPDLTLAGGDGGSVRLAELTRGARPLLVVAEGYESLAATAAGWHDRVDVVTVPPPSDVALLVRPDGLIAWERERAAGETLREALTRWFGAGTATAADAGSRRGCAGSP